MDIDAFAHALIQDAVPGSDPFWNNSARDIMVGILRYCHASGKTTNRDTWETATLSNRDLYNLLVVTAGGEAGALHLADADGTTAGSIRCNLTQFIKVFDYMSYMTGDFSITKWVEDQSMTGTIFITNYAKLQNTLRPIISLFIQTVGRVLLSQTDDHDNRLFFLLDEYGQLPPMATIQNLMTTARSKGGAIFIGVQDIAQIDKLYKKESRTTILNSASNRIIFNLKDRDEAKFFSADFGETEYYEYTASKSLSMGKGDRVNTARQRRKEFLVTPEDIQALPDLSAFVSIGHHDLTLSSWKYTKLDKKNKAFIQRPELDLVNAIDIEPPKLETIAVPNQEKPDLNKDAVESELKVVESMGTNQSCKPNSIKTIKGR